ncbi:MAG: helix-turn-helix transcriptional regulator [Pseudomonadota bacterium]
MTKNPVGRHSVRRTGKPNPVDVHVGSRVRLRRTLLGLSQEKLGDSLGLTFQQVQKYERGANRIGASRLFDLSRVLDVPVSFFFDDMPKEAGGGKPSGTAEITYTSEDGMDEDPMVRRETLDLVRTYYQIEDPQVRKRVFELAKSLSGIVGEC